MATIKRMNCQKKIPRSSAKSAVKSYVLAKIFDQSGPNRKWNRFAFAFRRSACRFGNYGADKFYHVAAGNQGPGFLFAGYKQQNSVAGGFQKLSRVAGDV